MTLVFNLPMPPNITNRGSGRGHWAIKYREQRAYYAACDALQAAGLLPPPPFHPIAQATVSAVMYLGAHMDDDNALARCSKWPLDWIRTRGYIVDDRRKNLKWKGLPEQVVKRDGNYRIELTLAPEAA